MPGRCDSIRRRACRLGYPFDVCEAPPPWAAPDDPPAGDGPDAAVGADDVAVAAGTPVAPPSDPAVLPWVPPCVAARVTSDGDLAVDVPAAEAGTFELGSDAGAVGPAAEA